MRIFLNIFLYLFTEVGVFYIFDGYGRDNLEYVKFFESEDYAYLEPFWILFLFLIKWSGVAELIQPLYMLFGFMVLTSSLFFFSVIKKYSGALSDIFILILVCAYQISIATGALRQGVSFFLIATFLITGSRGFLWLSVVTHTSGVVYLLLVRNIRILVSACIFVVLIVTYAQFEYIENSMARYADYLDRDMQMSLEVVLFFIILKIATAALFLKNYHFLLANIKVRYYAIMILVAPVLQIMVYIIIPIPVITDRLNMLVDPFNLVGMVLCSKNPNLFNYLFVAMLVIPKFLIRLHLALLLPQL